MSLELKKLYYATAIILLGSIAVTEALACIGFLLYIPITPLHFPCSFIFVCVGVIFLWRQKKSAVYAIVFSVLVVAAAVAIATQIYDNAYDGMHYHLTSVVELLNGWNPIYQQLPDGWTNNLCNSFAGKGIWYFSAALAKFSGHINASKAYHFISGAAALCMAIPVFSYPDKGRKRILSYFLSIIIVVNPVLLYQFTSNYADAYLYNIALCLICSLILVDRKDTQAPKQFLSMIIISSIGVLCNIKFTGIFFAGFIYGIFYLKWFYISRTFEILVKKSLCGVTGLFFGLFIGINPYITNPLNSRNMFHPMLGSNKIDLMGLNVPEEIKGKSSISKLVYALFSGADGKRKFPLRIERVSFSNLGTDLRYEGFGIFFSCLLIFALICLVYLLFHLRRLKKAESKQYMFLCLGILLMGLIFPEAWWARYFPFWWMLPFLVTLIMLQENIVTFDYVTVCVSTIAVLNNLILGMLNFEYSKSMSDSLKTALEEFKGQTVTLYVDEELFGRTSRFLLSEYGINSETASASLDSCDWNGLFFSLKRQE